MKAATIYLVTNLVNGDTYVGVTRFTSKHRWTQHCYVAKRKAKTYFHNAIKKYGHENFSVIDIASCLDLKYASNVEKEVIKSFLPVYNQTNGGELTIGKRVPKEVIDRIIAKNTGLKRTAEMNAASSARVKARYVADPTLRGKMINQLNAARLLIDHEKRIAASRKSSKDRVWTDESRAKLSASCMGRKYSKEITQRMARKKDKPVECTSLNMTFDSVSDAASACGLSISGVSSVCRGKRNQANGLRFQFI